MYSSRQKGTVRVKSKYGDETHRFALTKNSINFEALKKEVARVHGLPKNANVNLLYKNGAEFDEIQLAKALETQEHPYLSFVVKVSEPENEDKAAWKLNPNDGTARPPFVDVPYPWAKREITEEFPPIETKTSSEEYDVDLDPPTEISRRFKRHITVFFNGERHEIRDVQPDVLLAQFMRTKLGLTGTKIVCGEGGCGACTVLLSSIDPVTEKVVHRTTNACMRLLATCDGMAVTNVTGLGNSQDGFNPLQKIIAAKNGSQCGMCTPGMVTKMFELLIETPSPTSRDVEDNFQGNLCRCTGYRAILDAFQTFARDPEEEVIEETKLKIVPNEIYDHVAQPLFLRRDNFVFFRPTSLDDVFTIQNHYKRFPQRLVVGNTSIGVNKQYEFNPRTDDPRVFIDIGKIPQLLEIKTSRGGVTIGSSVTISNLVRTLQRLVNRSSTFEKIVEHILVIASPQIRNTGSWIGNIMTAKNHPEFPSDLRTLFTTVGAEITISVNGVTRTLSMVDFFDLEFTPTTVVHHIFLPFEGDDVVFDSFKIRARVQLAHPVVNAAFFLRFEREGKKVKEARLVFGGITAKSGPVIAKRAARFLEGKPFDVDTVQGTLKILATEVSPFEDTPTATKEYRRNLVLGTFFKFALRQQNPRELDPQVRSGVTSLFDERPISKGTFVFPTPDKELAPLSFPVPHITAMLQASGEAQYTGSLPHVDGMLWAAPVLSTHPKAKILRIDARPALRLPGVVRFLSAKDLEEHDVSNDIGNRPGDEFLFACGEVHYVGQMIGLILTDSPDSSLGERAAKLVRVDYEDLPDPVFSLQDALKRDDPPRYKPLDEYIFDKGDVDTAWEDCDHVVEGKMYQGPQRHFYLETQSAIAIPQDGDKMRVIAATQGPSPQAEFLASVLRVPQNHLIVETLRDGGAYGGKFSRSRPNTAAVAVASKITKKSVRCQTERVVNDTNMGKRNDYFATYKVGFNDDGHILSVQLDIVINAGDTTASASGAQSFSDNAYNIPNFRTSGKSVTTNLPVNLIMRAPGSVNGVFFMENIIERVAMETGLDGSIVREMNFYKDGDRTPNGQLITNSTLPEVWDEIHKCFNLEDKIEAAEEFNRMNRFKKRGVAVVPLKYRLGLGGYQGALVNVSSSDATVQVTTSGAESGQGLVTKVAQAVALGLGISIDKIVVLTNSTEKIPNFTTTGGSSTSEECVQAALLACEELNMRLAPFRESMPNATWEQIIAASFRSTNLSASGFFAPVGQSYFIWAAAITEVEIDVLTGEQTVLSYNLVYDAGQALNPLVDLGQLEGAAVMGLGLCTLEKSALKLDNSGTEATLGTWDYHVPCSKSIPLEMNVKFLDKTPNPLGILGSKAVGEPPLITAISTFFAVKNAIAAAREEFNDDDMPFELDSPLTFEDTQLNCNIPLSGLSF